MKYRFVFKKTGYMSETTYEKEIEYYNRLAEDIFHDACCLLDFGYNKANEWHEVKDKGLPKNNNDGATYLLFTVYGRGGSPVVAHFKERDSQLLMNTWTGAILTEDKIVSWKEFVFPKE